MLDAKRVLVTGGTGSLGRALVRRLLSGELGKPAKVVVFSRDEAKIALIVLICIIKIAMCENSTSNSTR